MPASVGTPGRTVYRYPEVGVLGRGAARCVTPRPGSHSPRDRAPGRGQHDGAVAADRRASPAPGGPPTGTVDLRHQIAIHAPPGKVYAALAATRGFAAGGRPTRRLTKRSAAKRNSASISAAPCWLRSPASVSSGAAAATTLNGRHGSHLELGAPARFNGRALHTRQLEIPDRVRHYVQLDLGRADVPPQRLRRGQESRTSLAAVTHDRAALSPRSASDLHFPPWSRADPARRFSKERRS